MIQLFVFVVLFLDFLVYLMNTDECALDHRELN